MKSKILQAPLLITGIVLLFGCSESEQRSELPQPSNQLPEHIQKLENLTVYSLEDQQDIDTVELVKETVFESNEEVFIEGYTGEVLVDDQDRVYIVGQVPGNVNIYVFNPDGSFITKFMKEGRGPGEVEAIGSMKIGNNKLYVLGPRLQKYAVFSLDDFSLVHDAVIEKDSVQDKKFSLLRAKELFVDEEEKILMKFLNSSVSDTLYNEFFYQLHKTGQILPDEIFRQKKYGFYPVNVGPEGEVFMLPLSMPFNRSSLFEVTESGTMYSAWTNDFLIKEYNSDGDYRRAFYYPYQRSRLNIEELDLNETHMEALEGKDIPGTWPAVHTFEVDDERRFWVSTISESDSTYDWWVLDMEGKLIADFSFRGERKSRYPASQPMIIIKNGYFYTRERDIGQGIDRIIKYKISFKDSE